ncbi:hypothetical protein BH23CHL8_BH23CHL8_21760 [soil metagenome]
MGSAGTGARPDGGAGSVGGEEVRVTDEATTPPAGWDERAVHVSGGHVMQSAAWGEYRRGAGLEPRYLTFSDGRVALASLRRSPLLPGTEAAVRRGPPHAGDPVEALASRAVALAEWARGTRARNLFLDPGLDADPAWESAIDAAGFEPAEEREPSIHVMRLALPAGGDTDAAWSGLAKSTRQRIRAAEASGTSVREDPQGERLETFAGLLRERADSLGIPLQSGTDYMRGWRILLREGLARLLLAEHAGDLVGGLFIHIHGGIHSTAYSADAVERRHDLPGAMHLVRWVAIRDALTAGVTAIELGGVDLPGHREPPRPGDPNRGLYEHKRSFGATWVERSPARRIVLRPWVDRLARARRRAVDLTRRVGR